MNKIAFIYPGQGAQKAGMGKDFYAYSPLAAEIYDKRKRSSIQTWRACSYTCNSKTSYRR